MTLRSQELQQLARAIVREPPVLLCDEPTGSLDPGSSDRIAELLESESDRGRGVLVVTHSPALASRASRVLELVDGRLAS
ncbi:AAA family ATPase [Microbacterium sp. HJ5]